MRYNFTGLTDERVKHDREEGFVVVPELFDREDLRAAEDAITDLTERAVSDPANLAEVLESGVEDATSIERSFRHPVRLWAPICGPPLRVIDVMGGGAYYAVSIKSQGGEKQHWLLPLR